MKRLPKNICREARRRLELTQAEFAELLGLSEITVKYYESGYRTIKRHIENLILLTEKNYMEQYRSYVWVVTRNGIAIDVCSNRKTALFYIQNNYRGYAQVENCKLIIRYEKKFIDCFTGDTVIDSLTASQFEIK